MEYKKEDYIQAISGLIPWIKENISGSTDGTIRVRMEDIKKDMGPEFANKAFNDIFKGLRHALFYEDIIVTKGRQKIDGGMILLFRTKIEQDKPPTNPMDEEEEESVPGINEIKESEDFNDFEPKKIVEIVEANKNIIKKVESIARNSIDIYLNLGINRQDLVKGIIDMINNFGATSVEYEERRGEMILGFAWD